MPGDDDCVLGQHRGVLHNLDAGREALVSIRVVARIDGVADGLVGRRMYERDLLIGESSVEHGVDDEHARIAHDESTRSGRWDARRILFGASSEKTANTPGATVARFAQERHLMIHTHLPRQRRRCCTFVASTIASKLALSWASGTALAAAAELPSDPAPAQLSVALDDQRRTEPTETPPRGFIDFNAYPYLSEVDSDSVFTLNALVNLPHGLSYFSLLNLMNQLHHRPLAETAGYYTEQSLRYAPFSLVPLDLTLQYNLRSGDENDRLRLGLRWRLDDTPLLDDVFHLLHLTSAINFHVLQIDREDGYVWQMEYSARLSPPYLDERLYVAGFADHTFNGARPPGAPSAPLVMEIQAGVRLLDQLYAVVEYRINQYRVDSESNIALGAEYVALF